MPIRVRDHVLRQPLPDREARGADFEDEDEEVLATLAVAGRRRHDNGALYEEAVRRARWLTREHGGGDHRPDVRQPARRGDRPYRPAGPGDHGSVLAVFSLPEADGTALAVERPPATSPRAGTVLPLAGTLSGAAFADGRPAGPVPAAEAPAGPAVAVPVTSGDAVHGCASCFARPAAGRSSPSARPGRCSPSPDRSAWPWSSPNARGHRAVCGPSWRTCDRIARDLHDLAIQRLLRHPA
ncbi:hypothetical protein [Streptomyces thioluteus]|uniref:hypothetical protein n=1 Tax=Streptomyces thioluteus TaxID=66431 RepID=UPI0031EC3F98